MTENATDDEEDGCGLSVISHWLIGAGAAGLLIGWGTVMFEPTQITVTEASIGTVGYAIALLMFASARRGDSA